MNRFLELLRSNPVSPIVIAHRGDSFRAPENTLEAAKLAKDAGAAAWELDVQVTRDSQLVVIHDDSLDRTTNVATRFADDARVVGGSLVGDFTLAEIRSLDAGTWFLSQPGKPRSSSDFGSTAKVPPSMRDHYLSGKVVVPTLEEALSLTRELGWLVNIEIKSFPDQPPGLVPRVLEMIERLDMAESVLISSFDHRDIAGAHQGGRKYGLGILVHTPLYRPEEYAASLVGADTVHLSAESLGSESRRYRIHRDCSGLGRDVVEALKARNIPALVYTVNDHSPGGLAEHLAGIGISGVFTDDPSGAINP
jgi:glycerophosphoryl diester phosphodiesterase